MTIEEEQSAINRRQKMAQLLMEQGQQPMEINQVAGGYVVPVSPLAGVAKVAQQLAGAYTGRKTDEAQSELNKQKVGALVDAVNGGELNYGKLAESGVDPSSIAKIIVDRQNKQTDLEQKLAEKKLELSLPTTEQRNAEYATNGNIEGARKLVADRLNNPLPWMTYNLNAANSASDNARKEKQAELSNQEAYLKIKELEDKLNQNKDKSGQKSEAQQNVETTIAALRDQYDQLKNKGAITDTSKGGIDNLSASASSSTAGQALGKMFGTEAQSLRNNIAQTRPILLQQIMKATGMSAKQMDSNAELKLYLSTATDPTLDYQTNMKALDNLMNLYGGAKSEKPPASSGNVNVNISPETWANMTPEQRKTVQDDIAKEQGKPDPFAGFTPELKAQFLKEHPEYGR